MRKELRQHERVVLISTLVGIDLDTTVGKLHRFWCWADSRTANGRIKGVTRDVIDAIIECKGFCDAYVSTGWAFFESDGTLVLNKWQSRNHKSARQRELNAERQRRHREKTKRDSNALRARQNNENNGLTEQNRTEKLFKEEESPREAKKKIDWSETGGWTGIQQHHRETWSKAYPACNVDLALAQMHTWLVANPANKKSNYGRFIVNWLKRTQDQGGNNGHQGKIAKPEYKTNPVGTVMKW